MSNLIKKSNMGIFIVIAGIIAIGIVSLLFFEYRGSHNDKITNYTANYYTNHKTNYSENPERCESLNGVGDGIEKAKCYIKDGNLNMSLKICENLSIDKDECIGRIAIYLADNDINKSFEVCKNSSDYYTCSTNAVAVIASKNISEGWKLCSNVAHMMCNNLIIRIAASKNESSWVIEKCNNYGWWYDKCQCYGIIFNTIVKNNADITQRESNLLELCDYMPTKCSEDYKIEVAVMALQHDYKKAVSICENVSFYSIDVCYLNIVDGVNKFNHSLAVEICNRINHEYERNSCLSKI